MSLSRPANMAYDTSSLPNVIMKKKIRIPYKCMCITHETGLFDLLPSHYLFLICKLYTVTLVLPGTAVCTCCMWTAITGAGIDLYFQVSTAM